MRSSFYSHAKPFRKSSRISFLPRRVRKKKHEKKNRRCRHKETHTSERLRRKPDCATYKEERASAKHSCHSFCISSNAHSKKISVEKQNVYVYDAFLRRFFEIEIWLEQKTIKIMPTVSYFCILGDQGESNERGISIGGIHRRKRTEMFGCRSTFEEDCIRRNQRVFRGFVRGSCSCCQRAWIETKRWIF